MGEMDAKASSTPILKLFGAKIPIEERPRPKVEEEEEEEEKSAAAEKKAAQKVLPCPRCKSVETKFCYFNNYNVNQPRHFCKGCQRYWTAGGALRNVPFGAGRRKSKPPCHVLGRPDAVMGEVVLVEQWADVSPAAKRRAGVVFGHFR